MKKIFLLSISVFLAAGCEMASDKSGPYSSSNLSYGVTSDMMGGTGPISVEQYNTLIENPFVDVAKEATSTFSIDADGASYANVRRFLSTSTKPVADAIRTEELVNYFPLNYADPTDGQPIAVDGEVSECPWESTHKLIRIGIKDQSIPKQNLLPSNIVLLIDVSGSMSDPNKLALLKEALPNFVDNLRA